MAIFEVVLRQTYEGQECINRMNYVSSGTPASVSLSFALAWSLGAIHDAIAVPPGYPPTKLMRRIAACQVNSVQFETLSVRNLYSDTDFYETPFVPLLTGTALGSDGMPPFNALGFYSTRIRQSVRRGTKRFVGVPEAVSTSGGQISSALLNGTIKDLANELSEVLNYDDEGNQITFTPAVCAKERYTVPASGRNAYRYYATEAEQMSHTAVGVLWTPYTTVRSQTSRQYGRGR